ATAGSASALEDAPALGSAGPLGAALESAPGPIPSGPIPYPPAPAAGVPAPPAAPARGGSGGVWLALVALVFAAGAVAVLNAELRRLSEQTQQIEVTLRAQAG